MEDKKFKKMHEELIKYAQEHNISYVSIADSNVVSINATPDRVIVSLCSLTDITSDKLHISPKKLLRNIRFMVDDARKKHDDGNRE